MAYYRDEHPAEDSRSKRQQILDAAYEVFSRKGFHRATVDEIIALADTGKGTVYNYFVNKEQLFYTLIHERSEPFEASLTQVVESDQPAMLKLQALVKMFLRFYIDNADLWRVMMHEIRGFSGDEHSQLTPEIREKYRQGFFRVASYVETVLSQGINQGILREVDVRKVAFSLFSVILTFVYQNYVQDNLDETAQGITDIFFNGIARR